VFFVATTGSDTNPGTLRAPWRSIQKAMDNLQPDQLAYVRAGTYETGGTFGTSADTYLWTTSCSATAPCSIVGYPGERPVLHGQIRIEGKGLRLSGFIIEGPLSADVAACSGRRANQVDLVGASYIALSHNEIRQNDYHGGISLSSVGHVQILSNRIHHNGRFALTTDPCTGNEVFETDHGIYWQATDGQGGNLVAGNLIDHNRAKGVQFFDGPITDGVTVVHNTIVDNGDAGLIMNGSVNKIRVVNNVVAFNGQAVPRPQIRVQAGTGHVVTRNLTYDPDPTFAGVEGTTGVSDNVVADPLFLDRVAGDYHVSTGSPAIDQALTAWAVSTDLDGVGRPVGVQPDLGAYER
jgi:parallel beta helix pectate lyase-like protein